MKKSNLKFLFSTILAGAMIASCSNEDDSGITGDDGGNPPSSQNVITGNITSDTTLDASVAYTLEGSVRVESGATLTIPAGTVITSSAADGLDALIIDQGAQINAVGTSSNPIVFTANVQAPGQWGGIVLLGRAPINVAGGTSSPEFDASLTYGGTIADDNSGTLSFVRVEYGGASVIEGSVEYNGFSFYAVGSGTTVNNLQAFAGSDDGFEWFGGTIDGCNNLLSVGNEDDSFDWAEGWTGGGSNWIAVQQAVGDNGIEADNNEDNNTATPASNPTISDITLTGLGSNDGMRLRRGTGAQLSNVVITNFSDGLDIRDNATIANVQAGTLSIDGIRFGNVTRTIIVEDGSDVSSNITIDPSATGADASVFAGWTTNFNTGQQTTAILSGEITTNTALDANIAYTLQGSVIVQEGATLTIPAGTVITTDPNDGLDALIINQGAMINATGTANDPIVFTSIVPQPGQWGGIVLLGRAPINVAGGTSSPEFDASLSYGGTAEDDNSGTLTYVRVEYAGASVIEGSVEYNGFSFYAVGNSTTINNLEAYSGSDDGFEWFGGTVDGCDNLLSIANEDDSFDWAEGWTGSGSNWIAVQDGVGDNGIEADNNEDDNTLTPLSSPTISDLTLVGLGFNDGMRLRRGTAGNFSNVVITNFDQGLDIRDNQTIANAQGGTLVINGIAFNNIVDVNVVVEGGVDLSSAITEDANATGASTSFAEGWSRFDSEGFINNF
ncbi:hypothetical protein GWK08_14255 [Leptobacterium flavescens]|uniref:Multidrug transporter n=1 Tax=Leptobacterium flavescens TaxID=472055 RepID=A0A6P0UMW9_9FLAO|nr:hypothetical protein [Leptobacterium flavescens]NER14614.1 hypothetical protein [Leptobacterium flavescens]